MLACLPHSIPLLLLGAGCFLLLDLLLVPSSQKLPQVEGKSLAGRRQVFSLDHPLAHI